MCKTPIAYLLHILEECNYILSVVTDDLPMYQFLSDETLKRAVCRSLEIVGEVTRKFPQMLNINGVTFNGNIWLE